MKYFAESKRLECQLSPALLNSVYLPWAVGQAAYPWDNVS